MINGSERIIGHNGCELISDTSAHTGLKRFGFIVQEDTVVSALTGTKDDGTTTINLLSSIGLSGKTLKQGAFLPCPMEYTITAITLTSGSVILY